MTGQLPGTAPCLLCGTQTPELWACSECQQIPFHDLAARGFDPVQVRLGVEGRIRTDPRPIAAAARELVDEWTPLLTRLERAYKATGQRSRAAQLHQLDILWAISPAGRAALPGVRRELRNLICVEVAYWLALAALVFLGFMWLR